MSRLQITVDDQVFEVEVIQDPGEPGTYEVWVDGVKVSVVTPQTGEAASLDWLLIDNRPYEIAVDRSLAWIRAWSGRHSLQIRDLEAVEARPTNGDGRVKAPIPGLIAKVHVREGDRVELGQSVVVLEAMKMENEIRASRSGTVARLSVQQGQTVGMGEVLLEID